MSFIDWSRSPFKFQINPAQAIMCLLDMVDCSMIINPWGSGYLCLNELIKPIYIKYSTHLNARQISPLCVVFNGVDWEIYITNITSDACGNKCTFIERKSTSQILNLIMTCLRSGHEIYLETEELKIIHRIRSLQKLQIKSTSF